MRDRANPCLLRFDSVTQTNNGLRSADVDETALDHKLIFLNGRIPVSQILSAYLIAGPLLEDHFLRL